MNKVLTLHIDTKNSLEIVTELNDETYVSNLYNTVYMVYLHSGKDYVKVHRFATGHDLEDWWEKIEACLHNNRQIPSQLDHDVDLGLCWNNYRQKIIEAQEAGKNIKNWDWPGSFLLFFENKGDQFNSCMTFLYNDVHGNIIFQTSSAYPWFFKDQPPFNNYYIPYATWLAEYKILYKSFITRDVAKEWVNQLQNFYDQLEAHMPFEK